MNVKKLLAIVLAVLMVIPALAVPTAAEGTDPYTVHHEFNQFDESETPYLVKECGGAANKGADWSGRSHDKDELIWKFPLSNPSSVEGMVNALSKFTVTGRTRGELAIALSLDGASYVEAYSIMTDTNLSANAASDEFKYQNSGTYGLVPYVRTYDLTATLSALLAADPAAEYVYLKLTDVAAGATSVNGYVSAGGWEGYFLMFNADGSNCPVEVDIVYDADTYVEIPKTKQIVFTPGTDDSAYVYAQNPVGKNDTLYYLDENGAGITPGSTNITYLYDLSAYTLPETLTWTACVGQNLIIEFSVDRANWVEIYNNTPNGNDRKYRTFDIAEAYAAEQEKISTNLLFIRLKNSVPGGGWGGAIEKKPVTLELIADKREIPENEFTFTPGINDGTYKYGDYGVNSDSKSFVLDENAGEEPNYIKYMYEITSSELPEVLTWTASVGQNLIIDVSVDNFHWVEIYNETPGDVVASEYMTFDLAQVYAAEKAKYSSNMIYVRLRNSRPGQGWGGKIDKLPVTLKVEYPEHDVTGNVLEMNWTVKGQDESKYWQGGASFQSNGTYYYTDGRAKGVMLYSLADADLSSEILWTAKVAAAFQLDVSLDGSNWVTAFRNNDTGFLAGRPDHNNYDDSNGVRQTWRFTAKERTFDLTAAVKEAGKIATSKSALYIRFGDSHVYLVNADGTENTAKTSGWGGQIHGTIKLSVRVSGDMGVAAPLQQTIVTGPLDKHADGVNYVFAGDVNTVLPWGDYRGGQMWHTFAADAVDATDPANPVLLGTYGSNNTVWYADNTYFTLRYELPAGISEWQLSVPLGNEAGVYYAYTTDTATPDPINEFSAYTMIWNYVDDNGGNRPSGAQLSFGAKTSDEVYANGGYLQLLFVDYSRWRETVLQEPGYTDTTAGWGPKITLGQNYPITLSCVMTVDEAVKSAGMKSVALNLTENFNLIYNASVPLASEDAVIEIGFKGETMNVVTPHEDGTYRFEDILPQRMGDTIVFRMSGTVAGLASFEYELEYSVKQYCTNMLIEEADDAVLCALLRDILSYGAAVQKYNGYQADALVNDGITDRTFENVALNGVFSGQIVGAAKDAAWVSGSLTLENITLITFTFAAEDVTDLKVVITKNTGEKLVFDAADFTDAGVSEAGKQLWQVSVPMMACEYHTGLIATFAKAGTEDADMDHYLIYSVNTYVSKMYGQSTPELDRLLGAIYNYGESTRAYVLALAQ